ncbi:hypothetical protein P389DRAFT_36028 [Cystobasidium minutum MCA 4210]|uniref:uncharacterized protein n=1 Tax=Cystobasidium minutum MCA 4210 TaxID=1397322 RepID=UPI0034CF264A|eukprot:jgi/Rhomi1/36028/CE36027_2328
MDPMLPLDQRHQQNSRARQHQHSNSTSSVSSKPGGNDGRRQETSSHPGGRYVPGYSPLPSTSTMPLSLQQLGSAASSTDSLNGPGVHSSSAPTSRPALPRHHGHSASQSSVRTDVTRQHHQGLAAPTQWEGMEASRRYAAAPGTNTGQPLAVHSLSSNSYGYKRSNHDDPSPSIYSARSTSSANSLPPTTESSLSASTIVNAYADPKGKGRATLTSSVPVVISSKKRVPTEIEEAVRNLGLAPPGTPLQQETHGHSPYLSVPSARSASRSAQSLSRSPSHDASAASDAASLSGTIASSIGSTSQDAHSISAQSTKSSKKSTASKTKKKKPKAVTTTSVIASSASPAPSSTSTALLAGATIEVKPKKKKKKQPLPTSSGKPPGSTRSTPASPAPTSPGPSSPAPSNRPAPPVQKATTRPSRPAAAVSPAAQTTSHPSHPPSHSSALPLHRPVAQAPHSQAHPSRNRHLDETALLRRFPNTPPVAANPVQASAESRPRLHLAEHTSHESAAPAVDTSNPTASDAANDADEPPPPPWTAPATTITLAFTPMHAYLSAYHDPVDQPSTSTGQTAAHPPIPDSPPPAFRSRTPSPTSARPSSMRRSATRTSSVTDPDLPDVDLDLLEERSRGYASSENELDLLNSQGRHSGTATPPNDDAHGDSSKGLRWQLRHWEAWRREGVSMEERMRRLQEWNTGAQLSSNLSRLSPTEAIPDVQPEVVNSEDPLAERSSGLAPASIPNVSDRRASPARSDLSHPSGSGTSQPRFPSVGTIRRVRLQRFEAERQSTRSMADVVQSSPTTSQVGAPRHAAHSLLPPTSTSIAAASREFPPKDEAAREQVRTAVLQAALGRGATHEEHPVASEAAAPALTDNGDDDPSEQTQGPAPTSTVQPQTSHQLARQLAAQVEARQRQSVNVSTPPASPRQGIQTNDPVTSSVPTTPVSSRPSNASPGRTAPDSSSGARQLNKAASRISRLFRPNMGPRQQSPRKEPPVEKEALPRTDVGNSVSPSTTSIQDDAEPVMTLPKAPPRLTTDPLSTDNLRKLSRRQLRSPSVHAPASASSSSSEDGLSDSSSSEEDQSGSESDSADDESTKKPASTVSHLGGRLPPSIVASSSFGAESEREAAAASWRRTEDGRRHSALLSRPLSIKRKPPPLPPKRWGGVWDRDAIQERLRRSFNLLDEDEAVPSRSDDQPGSQLGWLRNVAQNVIPGSLSTVREDEPTWEVVGQEATTSSVDEPMRTWHTVGRDEQHTAPTVSRFVAPVPRSTPNMTDTLDNRIEQHVYSEADFSTTRRPPPPPPRFAAARNHIDRRTGDIQNGSSPFVENVVQPNASSRVSLQRTPAVRRPQSMLGQRQSNGSEGRASPEISRSPPPSPEIRRQLSHRSRHIYSTSSSSPTQPSSVPAPAPTKPSARRPLPPLPLEIAESSQRAPAPASNVEEDSAGMQSGSPGNPLPEPSSTRAPLQEYTDLEVMLASMEDQAPGASSQVLREVLGVAQPATPEEIDSLPVGRVELERRRVDKKGKIKQKLSCVGINCNKCKICLQQFKEDELAGESFAHVGDVLAALTYTTLCSCTPCLLGGLSRRALHASLLGNEQSVPVLSSPPHVAYSAI